MHASSFARLEGLWFWTGPKRTLDEVDAMPTDGEDLSLTGEGELARPVEAGQGHMAVSISGCPRFFYFQQAQRGVYASRKFIWHMESTSLSNTLVGCALQHLINYYNTTNILAPEF